MTQIILRAGLGECKGVPDRLTSATFSALPISRGRIAGRSVLYAYPAISRPPYWHRNAMLKRVLELYRYWLKRCVLVAVAAMHDDSSGDDSQSSIGGKFSRAPRTSATLNVLQ